jgi:hypothetical protein
MVTRATYTDFSTLAPRRVESTNHFASMPCVVHLVVTAGDTMALVPRVAAPLVVLMRIRPAAPPPLHCVSVVVDACGSVDRRACSADALGRGASRGGCGVRLPRPSRPALDGGSCAAFVAIHGRLHQAVPRSGRLASHPCSRRARVTALLTLRFSSTSDHAVAATRPVPVSGVCSCSASPIRRGSTSASATSRPAPASGSKIEHRLFSQITQNWRGRPLVNREVVALIRSTTTKAGLRARAKLDRRRYPTGKDVPPEALARVHIKPHRFHGE